jgi:hypothetical protein
MIWTCLHYRDAQIKFMIMSHRRLCRSRSVSRAIDLIYYSGTVHDRVVLGSIVVWIRSMSIESARLKYKYSYRSSQYEDLERSFGCCHGTTQRTARNVRRRFCRSRSIGKA